VAAVVGQVLGVDADGGEDLALSWRVRAMANSASAAMVMQPPGLNWTAK
jgi:hypothetical protein